MDISIARAKINELVSEISKRASDNGLSVRTRSGYERADCTPCEATDNNLAYIFDEVIINTSPESSAGGLVFEIYVYCQKGEADEESLETELSGTRAAADEFFAGLEAAEDKLAYTSAVIEKERKVAEELRAELEHSAERAKKIGIITAAVGVGILLCAALLIILL